MIRLFWDYCFQPQKKIHKKFIVKLPNNRGYIKLWPYQYYGELGQSAHTTLVYDFIQE